MRCGVGVAQQLLVVDVLVVHERRVRRIDAAFERLQPVRLLERFRDVPMRLGGAQQFVVGCGRLEFLGPQVGPHHAAAFASRIGADADLRLEQRVRRFARHVDALAAAIELPAVVHAAHAALFVAAEEHRRAAMRAERVDQADVAVRIAKGDQIFAQQADADRWAVGFGHFRTQERRLPVAAHQIAHRRSRADSR